MTLHRGDFSAFTKALHRQAQESGPAFSDKQIQHLENALYTLFRSGHFMNQLAGEIATRNGNEMRGVR